MPSLDQARSWYSTTDPVHGFDHIVRVYHLALRIGRLEGADLRIVGAAALLHDFDEKQTAQQGPETDGIRDKTRANHQHTAAEFAHIILEKEGWHISDIQAVQHCIRAHRFRDLSEQPRTLEAQVLFDADKLDAIGAIGVARAIAYAVQAGLPAFSQPSHEFITTGKLTAGEQHSAYHEFLLKLRNIRSRLYTAAGKSLAENRRQTMVNYFEQLAAESLGEA